MKPFKKTHTNKGLIHGTVFIAAHPKGLRGAESSHRAEGMIYHSYDTSR